MTKALTGNDIVRKAGRCKSTGLVEARIQQLSMNEAKQRNQVMAASSCRCLTVLWTNTCLCNRTLYSYAVVGSLGFNPLMFLLPDFSPPKHACVTFV